MVAYTVMSAYNSADEMDANVLAVVSTPEKAVEHCIGCFNEELENGIPDSEKYATEPSKEAIEAFIKDDTFELVWRVQYNEAEQGEYIVKCNRFEV